MTIEIAIPISGIINAFWALDPNLRVAIGFGVMGMALLGVGIILWKLLSWPRNPCVMIGAFCLFLAFLAFVTYVFGCVDAAAPDGVWKSAVSNVTQIVSFKVV